MLLPLRGQSVSIRHRWKAGAVQIGRIFPTPPVPPLAIGLLIPTTPARRKLRQRWRGALAAQPAVQWRGTVRPTASPRRLFAGTAKVAPALPPVTFRPLPFSITRMPFRPHPAGRAAVVTRPRFQDSASTAGGLGIFRPAGSQRPPGPRFQQPKLVRFKSPDPAISRFGSPLVLSLRGDQRLRRRAGWCLVNRPSPLGGAITGLGYYVYSNTGVGDPINYNDIIATVYGVAWTSAPLVGPAKWSFGVRAFDGFGTEQNVDAVVNLVLNNGGMDITLQPFAPVGLRGFAIKAS